MRGPVPVYPNTPVQVGHDPAASKEVRGSKAAGLRRAPLPGSKLLTSCKKGLVPETRPGKHPCPVCRLTRPGPDPKRRAFRVANDGADLPATYRMVESIAVVKITLALPERQFVNESGRQRLWYIVGRQRTVPFLLIGRNNSLRGVPG